MTARILEVLTADEAKQTHIRNSMCRHRSECKQCDASFQGHPTASSGPSGRDCRTWGGNVAANKPRDGKCHCFIVTLYESHLSLPGSHSFY